MKNQVFFFGFLIFLAGCGHQSDEQIIEDAHNTYQTLAARYVDVLNSSDNHAVIKYSTRFGLDYRVNNGFWSGLFDDGYLDVAEIAPLHRAHYIMSDDSGTARKHMSILASRLLEQTSVYTKLKNLRDNLNYAQEVIRGQEIYIEEARILEQRRIQRAQLAEARRQTETLERIACARPVVCHVHQEPSPCCH